MPFVRRSPAPLDSSHVARILLATALTGLVTGACGSSPTSEMPDAFLAPDAALDCSLAPFARTLVGQHLQQARAGDTAAGRSSCRLYRAEVSIEAFDPATCVLSGAWGWRGTDDGGLTIVGGGDFSCPLAGASVVACAGEDIGTVGTSLASIAFAAPVAGPTTLTMETSDTTTGNQETCTEDAEPVP